MTSKPYRAEFGAVHHENATGFLFTVTPPEHAQIVADALNSIEGKVGRTAVPPTCKGSWSLNTACGKCAQCLETAPQEIVELRRQLESFVSSWRRRLGSHIANKRHLIDALAMGTQYLVDEADAVAKYRATIEQWVKDAALARTLGVPEPSLFDRLSPAKGAGQ